MKPCNFCGEILNATGDGVFGICLTQACKDARAEAAALKARADAALAAPPAGLSTGVIVIIVIAVIIFIVGIFLLTRKKS